jgi:simple sugar transport system permease protein
VEQTEAATAQPMTDPATARAAPRRGAGSIVDRLLENIVWVLIVVFSIGATLSNSFFFSIANFQNILIQATVLGVLSLGLAFTLLIREIDLSVVGNLQFSGWVAVALIHNAGVPAVVAMLAAIATGACIGLVNGFCVAKLKMSSLVETLAMGLVLGGALLAVTEGATLPVTDDVYLFIGNANIASWPVMPAALFATYLVAAVVLSRTPWGRRLYAVGGSPRAAFTAGISVDRTRIQAFVVSGMLAATAGILVTSWLNGINRTVGANLQMYAIAAPIIGGVSLFGGKGKVIGMLGGVLLLTVVTVALQITNISAFYVDMIGGMMIFLAVFVDAVRVRRGHSGD